MVKMPTEKQLIRISKIQCYLGETLVREYLLRHHFPTEIKLLNRCQAQKIITGLSSKIPTPPIYGIAKPWIYFQD